LLRAELFSIEQLKRHAVTLVAQHGIDRRPGPDRLLPRLADNARVLSVAYDVVTAAVMPGQRIVPSEAWLLDNFYLIEQQINLARRHLPRGYSRQLPRLAAGTSAGFPRIYDLALELISHMDGRVDIDNTTQFVAAYQSAEPLQLGELWAFPIMLQLALLENLRRVAVRIARRREDLDAAISWADRMLTTAENEPGRLVHLLAEFAHADVPLTAPFVEEFYARLQVQGHTMAFVQAWVEQKLHEQGVTASQLLQAASRTAASNQVSIANSIGSLRFIGATDWKDFVESLSVVEKILREDPTDTHVRQDFATRDRYRHVIEDIARVSPHREWDVATEALALAQEAAKRLGTNDRSAHVGYYLADQGRHSLEQSVGCCLSRKTRFSRTSRRHRLLLYAISILLLTAVMIVLAQLPFGGFVPGDWRYWLFVAMGLIGGSALAVSLVNRVVTMFLSPRTLPRLDFSEGIPDSERTMAVVPTLLDGTQDIDDLLEALEIRYLGNRDRNLFFALLTDFRDASTSTLPEDEPLLEYARVAIDTLNATYKDDRPCIFYLFHRPRVWNAVERIWMGHERKRGKLEQFNALLRGEGQAAFSERIGDQSLLGSIKYVITLDTDTQLPRDAARALVGNMAHPLNRPVYNEAKGRVVEGYAILQPRASISLTSASQTRFTKLYAGEAGIDPYTREISDVYQDIFAEGSFIGKGIYDVDAFRQAVDGRFPDNLILSHDLLEGGYARSALVTDVDLIEEHPASYAQEISRRHRWMRGDWQLVGWLWPRVPGPGTKRQPNPLSALSRLKIVDNLRRSLVSPALLVLLASGWLLGPGPAWFWLLLVAGIVFAPTLFGILIEFIRKPEERNWRQHLILTSQSVPRPLTITLLAWIMLPYEALICLDAILRSGIRMLFTQRGLLLWQLRSYGIRNARKTLSGFLREMWVAPILSVLLAVALWQTRSAEWMIWAPTLLLWLLSPIVGWWISTPLLTPEPKLTIEQRVFLRTSARRTWRFFADFVSPLDNWLPPDNFQEYPEPAIAFRTSPTNMGMALLADLAAYDFGYIHAGECLRLVENTLTAMEGLERYRGHFYNWYDTRTLQPLRPHYVSSVDSGNLAGSLLTLQAGLVELKDAPILAANAFQGLQDTLQVLAEHAPVTLSQELADKIRLLQDTLHALTLDGQLQTLVAADSALDELHRIEGGLVAWLPRDTDIDGELYYWARAFDQQFRALRDDLRGLAPEPGLFDTIPTLSILATAGRSGYKAAVERLRRIDDLSDRCRELAVMDFEFLYDAARSLLTIGFDVGERRRDPACYDLLASEARLASFLLIAQGQVPQKHWFALGRLLTSHGGDVSLISWSGSMFEYLMPQLIMPSYQNTLLDQTCKSAVLRQIEYGRQRAVPWGISESCYNATDMHQVYQYRAFGVPGMGLKRGLGDDLVIAPYASALALMVMPLEACRNLQLLAGNGFLGTYGFYEAIDYTPSRVPRGKQHGIVRTFMAHHQGMSLLAFEHLLLDQPMQRRFMSDPLARATQLLLQERVPKQGATIQPHASEVSAARPPAAEADAIMRVFTDLNTPLPEVHLLSNGRYHVMATHAGGGYSRWHDLAVTRWREDATADNWGTFIYLRDRDTGRYWSTAHQPTLRKADHYEAIFVQARAEYRRRDEAIDAHTEISVSPEDDVEIRRVTLTNQSSRIRHIEVTSYAEVVLAPLSADLAHRAFSNLFVQTEILSDRQAILCTRRPRTPGEQTPWMFHLFAASGANAGAPSYETDRSRFIGRGRTAANPLKLESREKSSSGTRRLTIDETQRLSNTAGPVLDPIVAIRSTLTLEADESATVQFISGVADTREAALALLDKYCDRHFIERAFEMAWCQSQEVLHLIHTTEADVQVYARLASSVIYANALRRSTPSVIARNQLGQSGLWRFSVSGDLPIVLLRIGDLNRIDLVKQMLRAHAYWRMKGLRADLVILNEDFSGYRAVLHDQIIGLINTGPEAEIVDKPGGVFVRRADELSEEDRVLFMTVARVVITDTAETLAEQVGRRALVERVPDRPLPLAQTVVEPRAEREHVLPARERIFCNGLGGFTPDGREYVITLGPGQTTPAPWVNVIASPHIGTVVSESGGSYTWVENAHEFRLTTWHNDPLSDSSGEALYIRDEDTGVFWSPTPLPAPTINQNGSGYVCRHGFGYSVFEHDEAGIYSELFTYVAMDAPVKFVVFRLRNHSGRPRRISLTGYWELVLGEWRHTNLMHIVTEKDPHSGALFARNAYGRECANRVVFAHVNHDGVGEHEHTLTGNRSEFIGRNGSLASPAALHRTRLSGRVGAGLDPCAALQTQIELADGQEREVVFVFGAASNTDEAQDFIQRFIRPAGARRALASVEDYWNHTLSAVQVETPDPAMDVLVNGWLLYQTLSCRLWGRSGYYQSGGAYGFRDQLQDTLALIHATPWLAREQLIRCAGRQFIQGDVQHWWHPPRGQGVRTHFSDDYLWLPYATCRYVLATGDTDVLDETVHFVEGRELYPYEEAYYDQPQRSAESASLYEHCVRAIRHGLRFGAHQLPLMGCGDWNDGMNLVGLHGKGESVWLAWFLYENLQQFARLAHDRGDTAIAELCSGQAAELGEHIEANAWDGDWYRRAWFDDGTPLGSSENDECQIDSISQSWAVISGGGDPDRARQAMASVDQRLVRRDAQLIQLLDPPFDKSALEPGYIKGYVPGVRENGGQYTHAAIWATMAFAKLGDRERAWELFTMLNPINHSSEPDSMQLYKVEPYVMCADVYGAPPHTGRGGWTWYTGAAGWMYRLALESLLGLKLEKDHLIIAPCVPAHWDAYTIHYRYRETVYHINVRCNGEQPEQLGHVTLDGARVTDTSVGRAGRRHSMIPLVNDERDHHVVVVVPF
jgi:cellobiose phosphorylase